MTPTDAGKLRIGLNTRLSIGVAAVVLASTFAIATAALQLVKTTMQESIESEAFARVSALADAVDQKFASRRTLLKTFGDSVEAQGLTTAPPLQGFLEKHPSLREAFDNVAFIGMDGDLVANLNGAQQIGKVNVKDRAYFRETVAFKRGIISQPYRNRLNGLAQVAITEPVLDAAGRVLFVISGSINLKERTILGSLADVKFGKTGYLFITTTDGVVVDHPRGDLVLQNASSQLEGGSEIDRAISGLEGTTEGIDHAGVSGLYAFKRIRQTNWILGSMYPRSEAFARVDAIERTAWGGALLLALLAGGMAFGVARVQLKPLTVLHHHMLEAQASPSRVAAQSAYSADEIGDLARTFDRLMQQRQASEKFLRDITDNLPAMVSHADAQDRYTFVNAQLCQELLLEAAELVGQPVRSAIGTDHDPQMDAALARVRLGEAVRFERRGSAGPDRHPRYFQTDLIPDLDAQGRFRGYYAMTSDVTQRKRIELDLARSEAQIRTITDNIPALVSHVDASLYYTFVNAQVRALHDDDAIVGKWMPAVRGAADFAVVEPYMQRALAGETVVIEKAGDPARGIGERTFKAHYIPDRDHAGTVKGVFAMTFDITDDVRLRKALTEQEKRLRDVTDSIPALVGYFDNDENCLFANSRARRMAGLKDESLAGVTLRQAVGEAVYAQQLPHLPLVRAGQAAHFPVHAPFHDKEGHFQVHLVPDKDLDERVQGFYMMAFNVTALKEAELRRADSERRLRTITDNLPALITYIDRTEKITFVNATCKDWLGVEPSALLGQHVRDVAGADLYAARRSMLARALGGERVEFEAETHLGGVSRITRVTYVPDTRADGSTQGIFSLSLDITSLKAVERKLTELARVDTLTGLPNRLALNELLPGAIARAHRAQGALALMFLDIDRFKSINDSLGHASGDQVLVEFAGRLTAGVRSTDTVARLAGDEFVIVLEHLHMADDAAAVARKVLAQVSAQPFSVGGSPMQVTTSIGIAFLSPGHAAPAPEELLARADAALYDAKSAGRNRFAFSGK